MDPCTKKLGMHHSDHNEHSGESGCGEMWQEEVWWPCVGTANCMGQLVLKVSVSVWAVLTVCMYGTTCSIRKSCIVCQYYKCLFSRQSTVWAWPVGVPVLSLNYLIELIRWSICCCSMNCYYGNQVDPKCPLLRVCHCANMCLVCVQCCTMSSILSGPAHCLHS